MTAEGLLALLRHLPGGLYDTDALRIIDQALGAAVKQTAVDLGAELARRDQRIADLEAALKLERDKDHG